MKVTIEIDEDRFPDLVRRALLLGFSRSDPNKAWTEIEYRTAIRFLINKLLAKKY